MNYRYWFLHNILQETRLILYFYDVYRMEVRYVLYIFLRTHILRYGLLVTKKTDQVFLSTAR